MHLRTGIVVTILAAAAGAAAGRATAPHVGPPVVAAVSAIAPGAKSGWSDVANPREGAPGSLLGSKLSESPARGSRSRFGGDARSQAAVVYVAGAVAKPGVYTVKATARADEAVRAAGGATAQADLVAVNLAARVEDGEEIAVPLRGAETGGPRGVAHSAAKRSRRPAAKRGHRRRRNERSDAATDDGRSPTEMVDVNDADEATLETLPGVGPSLAERIIAFRDLNGPFASTDELLDVGGMTAGKLDALLPYVVFH